MDTTGPGKLTGVSPGPVSWGVIMPYSGALSGQLSPPPLGGRGGSTALANLQPSCYALFLATTLAMCWGWRRSQGSAEGSETIISWAQA